MSETHNFRIIAVTIDEGIPGYRDEAGKIMGCVNCNHGRQNHDNEWRESARANTEGSQKRDTDFG